MMVIRNTNNNVDLDMFVVDDQENTNNVGGTYAKVETTHTGWWGIFIT